MYILECDPSQLNHVILTYRQADKLIRQKVLEQSKADHLLAEISQFLGADPIEALVLVNQAQSFTLIRVLATIFNALAYSKNLQLFDGQTPVKQLQPTYSQPAL
ncbi:MAG: hypothetical protein WCV88_01240 [Patescibacteria group bacterium]|jgi:hypothetical protein